MEPELLGRLRRSAPVHELSEAGQEPFQEGACATCRVGRRPDGACVFLATDQRCRLHAELGPREKPLACRVFPYVMVPTPVGVVVGLSHFCPEVRAGHGPPLLEQLDMLKALAQEARLPIRLSGPFRVWSDITTGWTGYSLWEEALLLHLDEAPDPLPVLDAALSALARNYRRWGYLDLRELLAGVTLFQDTFARDGAHELLRLAGGAPAETLPCSSLEAALVRSLVHRKLLLRYPTLLEGLALLCLVPRAIRANMSGPHEAIEKLELLLSHGSGAAGVALPLVHQVLSSGSPAPD